jgi:putative heme-binding domain-containing protein
MRINVMWRSARILRALVGIGIACCGMSVAWAQRDLKDIPDPDPELERKTFVVADGFEVNLYAADPLIAKPIQMNFDAQGRLWVASSSIYPQIQPGQAATDKILVIEDKDHDGVADETRVFVDGLLIPTGVEPGDGGAYVANSTEVVHFKDTDGDGKADTRRVMLSGFGTEDTHHIVHTFRWGMDGQLYFNQSIYIHSHIETPHGVRRLNGGGIWQLRPETMELSILMRGLVNAWGHQQDDWGQSFATDGAGGEGINYIIPGASYFTAVGAPRVVKGLNPGSPKDCGLEIVGGRHLPDDWQGNLITNDFRGHRVCRYILSDDASGFASREQTELIKSSHVAFRPIDVKMGPDGAIYIADWYNPIIQHGEVDFRDPRRDLVHGRIWRVTAKGRPLAPRPKLVDAPVQDLLASLASPEPFARHHAKLQLKARGSSVVPELAAWVKQLDPKDSGYEHLRLEALWAYQSLDVVEPDLLTAVLNSADPRARAAAVRIVPQWSNRLKDSINLLAPRVVDEHPRVRLEAIRALAAYPTIRAIELAMTALDFPIDKNIDYALWLTARDLQPVWLPKLQAGELDFGGNVRHLTFVLQAAGSPAVVKPLLSSLKRGQIQGDKQAAVLKLVAALGDAQDLETLFVSALTKQSAVELGLLESAARLRNLKPAGDLAPLADLLKSSDDGVKSSAARLAGLWKQEALRGELFQLFGGDKPQIDTVRSAAIEGLIALGGEASKQAFTTTATQDIRPGLRIQAAAALTVLDTPAAAHLSTEVLTATAGKVDPTPLFNAFLEQKNGAAQLAAALAGKSLPEDVAKLGIRAIRNSIREEPALLEALVKSGKVQTGIRSLTPAEMQQLVADVPKLGDPARGEALFRRQDLGCFKCHAIGGAGGSVGPDLVSIGASAQPDYLVDSLLNPSKQIKEGYHTLIVVTDQGKVYTGIKVTETDQDLVLKASTGEEIAIPLKSIDEKGNGGSLMPAGLTDILTRGELLDLTRFLSELGKIGPYAVGKARVARRWQTLTSTVPDRSVTTSTKSLEELLKQPNMTWQTIYSKVSGNLPSDELNKFQVGGNSPTSVVRTDLEVTTSGVVQFQMTNIEGLQIWLDGKAFPVQSKFTVELEAGPHQFMFAIDQSQARPHLRLELLDVPGSAAQVQFVTGK